MLEHEIVSTERMNGTEKKCGTTLEPQKGIENVSAVYMAPKSNPVAYETPTMSKHVLPFMMAS